MVNEVGAIDNLRLENQLKKLTSLVRKLVIGQHQPSTTARVCGIFTSVENPTNMCSTLQETESNHSEIVGSIGGYQYGKQPYQSRPYDSQQFGRQQYQPNPIQGQYPAQKFKSAQAKSKIPSTTIPIVVTTKSAITEQLTIFRGPDETVGDKQPRVSADYKLQQHAISAKFKCHDLRPQNAASIVSQLRLARSKNLLLQIIPNQRGNASVVSLRSGRELPQNVAPQQWSRPANAKSKLEADSLTLLVRKVETDKDLLKMFWKVEIYILLLDDIKKIPKYAKFLKELYVHKRKKMKGEVELEGVVLALTKNEVATASHKTLPKKCQDSEIFSFPCTIGECTFSNAKVDLGASINVMPTSIYKSLNFRDLEPTGMTIQLANRSVV
ncbi:hypothetical protein CR513_11286, partial [Mucuna pruriens]